MSARAEVVSVGPLSVLHAELIKTRQSRGWLGSVLAPLGVVLLGTLYFLFYPPGADKTRADLVSTAMQGTVQITALLWPLAIAVAAYLLADLEHRDRGLKFVFTWPASRAAIYACKALILSCWVAVSLFVCWAGTIVNAWLFSTIYRLEGAWPAEATVAFNQFFLRLAIVLIAVAALHYMTSLVWSHFAATMAAAAFLTVFGAVIAFRWEHADWMPYTYPSRLMAEFIQRQEVVGPELWRSAAYGVLFFGLGYVAMRRRSVRD